MLDLIIETIQTLLLLIWYIIEALLKTIIPGSWLPKKDLNGELVLVTGAGNGIGRLMSVKLAKLGCRLVLWDIDAKGNEDTATMIRKFGGQVYTYTVDLSVREQIYKTAEQVKRDAGDITILINNAGIVTGKRFLQCPDKLIEKTMNVNTMAHYWTTKAFLPAMIDNDHGHIVSIASSAGLVGIVGLADYCASKFAAVGFMESLYLELKSMDKNIECLTVAPYFINTGLFDGVRSRFNWILPILEADFAVDRIIDAIQTNQVLLEIPRILYFLVPLKTILPVKASTLLHRYFGATASMDTFVGRKNNE